MIVRKICCIGANNVGGPFSAVLAFKCPEIDVKVVDEDEEKIMKWNSGQLPVFENNLDTMVKQCLGKNLSFTCEAGPAIKEADMIFICVNTELKTEGIGKGKAANLKPLEDAARLIVKSVNGSKIVVEKSTVPLRAAETLNSIFKANHQTGRSLIVLSNPEFLSQGTAVNDLLFPERVLIGGEKTSQGIAAVETLVNLYENWVPRTNILTGDNWSTELAKLATNAFLAQKISSVNTLSELCEATNADVSEVAFGIGMDSRIGAKGLKPCLGFGGPSLHKDILNLVYLCESLNLHQVGLYWQKILDINEHQKRRFTKKILDAFFNNVSDKQFAILGFAFKKGTSNTTESPAIFVCKSLLEEGAKLNIFDPAVPKTQIMEDLMVATGMDEKTLKTLVAITEDPYEATTGTHGIVICTNWEQFASMDYAKVFDEMSKPACIFDGWKMLHHEELQDIGFDVHTIGKKLERTLPAVRDSS